MQRFTGWLLLIVVLCGVGVLMYQDMRLRTERTEIPSAITAGTPEGPGDEPERAAPVLESPAPSQADGGEASVAETRRLARRRRARSPRPSRLPPWRRGPPPMRLRHRSKRRPRRSRPGESAAATPPDPGAGFVLWRRDPGGRGRAPGRAARRRRRRIRGDAARRGCADGGVRAGRRCRCARGGPVSVRSSGCGERRCRPVEAPAPEAPPD